MRRHPGLPRSPQNVKWLISNGKMNISSTRRDLPGRLTVKLKRGTLIIINSIGAA